MTLKEIKSMFVTGEQWSVTRDGSPITIVGNLSTTTLPPNNVAGEVRTIQSAKSELVAIKRDGRPIHTTWPKASEVLEARQGFLKFRYDNGVVCSFEKVASYKSQAARDAQAANYGQKSYWDTLDKSAQEHFDYYMAKGDAKQANEMLTQSLSDALRGNEGA